MLDDFIKQIYEVSELWDDKLYNLAFKTIKKRKIDEELGRSSDVQTIKDFLDELQLVKQLYGKTKIESELIVLRQISNKDIDKAS